METKHTPLLETLTVDIACLGAVFVAVGCLLASTPCLIVIKHVNGEVVFHSQPATTTVEISILLFLPSQNYKGVVLSAL